MQLMGDPMNTGTNLTDTEQEFRRVVIATSTAIYTAHMQRLINQGLDTSPHAVTLMTKAEGAACELGLSFAKTLIPVVNDACDEYFPKRKEDPREVVREIMKSSPEYMTLGRA